MMKYLISYQKTDSKKQVKEKDLKPSSFFAKAFAQVKTK